MSTVVVSWGETLWDLYPEGPKLGGASANLAVHAAELGCESYLISRVGRDDLGRQALLTLQEAGVDTSGVTVDPRFPTGHVHVTFSNGQPHYRIGEHVAWDQMPHPTEMMPTLHRANVICFGTLAQRTPLVRGALRQCLETLPRRVIRLLDLNLRAPYDDDALIVDAIAHADVVKCNEGELAHLAALLKTSEPVRVLLEQFSVHLVAITRGARGCLLVESHARVDHAGFPSSGVDPVGAGDAFAAVLARDLARGRPLSQIAEHACRYAAWVAGQPGGMPRGGPRVEAAEPGGSVS